MTTELCESMEDKMRRCTHLAFDLAYCELSPSGSYFTPRELDDDDVWGWADGLVQESIMKKIEGRCSLQAMIDFDIEECENGIDKTIERFEKLLEELGPPVKLTPEEMTRRGYKGYE